MLRILKQLFTALLITLYASQASAMFIQPDWLDPTEPGVGTNRYAYSFNDPVNKSDPNGNFAVFGAIVGAVVGVAIQGITDAINGETSSLGAYAGAAVAGAVAGATAGLGTGAAIAGGAAGGALGSVTDSVVDGEAISKTGVVVGAVTGIVGGGGAKGFGKAATSTINNLSPHAKGKLGETITKGKYSIKGYKDTGKAVVPTGGKTPTGKSATAHYDHKMENVITGRTKTVESKFNNARLSKNQKEALPNVKDDFEISRTTSEDIGNSTAAGVSGGISGSNSDPNDW